jgi:hypothetical protein
MNCFVIMPFAPEFDDVYALIKNAVEAAAASESSRCFRLDESRPAGRITDRLVSELRAATICVADLTGLKPNVMWEVGYAMALSTPTILITQSNEHLPFDIKDMQCIQYDRARLNATLGASLKGSIIDTLGHMATTKVRPPGERPVDREAYGAVLTELENLKEIVGEAVKGWKQQDPTPSPAAAVERLAGAWVNKESGSHIYARVVRGELVAPYCFTGNDELTGVYFAWRKVGDYWFARYRWLDATPIGFTFLRDESVDKLTGAWWSSEEELVGQDRPPRSSGVASTWQRRKSGKTPIWAEAFFAECEKEGLAAILARAGLKN